MANAKAKARQIQNAAIENGGKETESGCLLILMEVLGDKDELDDNPNFTSDPHFYTIKMAVLSPCCKNNSRAVFAHVLTRLTRQGGQTIRFSFDFFDRDQTSLDIILLDLYFGVPQGCCLGLSLFILPIKGQFV